MTTTAAVATIGSGHRFEFCTGKMFTAGAPMAASAKNPYLVNKICFFHYEYCGGKSKSYWVGDWPLLGRQPDNFCFN